MFLCQSYNNLQSEITKSTETYTSISFSIIHKEVIYHGVEPDMTQSHDTKFMGHFIVLHHSSFHTITNGNNQQGKASHPFGTTYKTAKQRLKRINSEIQYAFSKQKNLFQFLILLYISKFELINGLKTDGQPVNKIFHPDNNVLHP